MKIVIILILLGIFANASFAFGQIYDDPVLKYLGWQEKKIIEFYGEPDVRGPIGGPGGEFFYYRQNNISFIFASYEFSGQKVVNNLDLFPGAKILGIKVGMTFDEIQKEWGEPFFRGYSEYSRNYSLVYWFGEIKKEEMLAEIEMYFRASSDSSPTELLEIRWKKYWW